MNSFSLAHLKSAPMPAYVRGVVSSFALMKELATGAGTAPLGGNSAANGVAAALLATATAGAIVTAGAAVLGATLTVGGAALAVGVVSAVVGHAFQELLKHNNIDFSNPIQALSDIGNNALDGFDGIREMISRLTDRDDGIANHLQNQDGSQEAFETLHDWADTLPEDLKQDLIDYLRVGLETPHDRARRRVSSMTEAA